MSYISKEQRQIWFDSLKKIIPKIKRNGWKRSTSDNYAKIVCPGVLQIEILDPHGKKHWLRISPTGEVYFAPVTMVCGGSAVF